MICHLSICRIRAQTGKVPYGLSGRVPWVWPSKFARKCRETAYRRSPMRPAGAPIAAYVASLTTPANATAQPVPWG